MKENPPNSKRNRSFYFIMLGIMALLTAIFPRSIPAQQDEAKIEQSGFQNLPIIDRGPRTPLDKPIDPAS